MFVQLLSCLLPFFFLAAFLAKKKTLPEPLTKHAWRQFLHRVRRHRSNFWSDASDLSSA